MAKFLFISSFVPTPFNTGGSPTALMYHTLLGLGVDHKLLIFSYNRNKVSNEVISQVEKDLHTEVVILKDGGIAKNAKIKYQNLKNRFASSPLPSNTLDILPSSIMNDIQSYNPDYVWLYPHHLLSIAKQLKDYKIVVTGPDCASLHYMRSLKDSYPFDSNLSNAYLRDLRMIINLEREWPNISNTRFHVVGQMDEKYFNTINNKQVAYFFPHPHYELRDKIIDFNKQRLKIIIGGGYNLYTYSGAKLMLKSLVNSEYISLRENYEFVFHGKGWEPFVEKMLKAGYRVSKAGWVDDYVAFLADHDIQLFPISIGSGTKAKVLDAASTGLVCVGSYIAFENIAVKDKESALLIKDYSEIPEVLLWILDHRIECNKIAETAKQNVRTLHNPKMITELLLQWVTKDDYNVNKSNYLKSEI